MTSLKQFKIRLKTAYNRYYPERQIFLRSDGRVRFLTLSPAFQASVSAVVVSSVLWGVYATVGYLTNTYLVASHRAEISTLQDRQSALGDGYRLLENDLAVRTALLEKRQKFLETVIGNAQHDHTEPRPTLSTQSDDGSIEDDIFNAEEGHGTQHQGAEGDNTGETENTDVSGDTGDSQSGASDDTDTNADHAITIQIDASTVHASLVAHGLTSADAAALNKQELRDRRHDIKAMLSDLEARQSRTALQILEAKRAKLAAIDVALAETQFTSQDLAQLSPANGEAGQGGPFLPLDGYTDFLDSPIFEADDYVPFAQLNEAWSTLEMALNALESIPTGRPAKKYYLSSKFGPAKTQLNAMSGQTTRVLILLAGPALTFWPLRQGVL